MIVATLARKPLKGAVADNVVQNGTGGLAIDVCRVVPTGERLGGGDESPKTCAKISVWKRHGNEAEAFSARVRENVEKATALGRWPANVVMVHAEGCVRTDSVEMWECTGECPVATINRAVGTMSGAGNKGGRIHRNRQPAGVSFGEMDGTSSTYCVDGGFVSRFFKQVKR